MKMKSFALAAMTGLLSLSLTYVAPAVAGTDDDGSAMQSDDNNPNSMKNNDIVSENNANTDQAIPDTATGDDDY